MLRRSTVHSRQATNMKTARPLSLLFVSFLFVSLLSGPSVADPASEAFVRRNQEELVSALREGDRTKIDEVFDAMIDYPTIGRDSLGEYWGELSVVQQEYFVCILKTLVSDAYRRDLRKTLDYQVEFQGSDEVERGSLVKTVAKSKTDKREDPISINYVVHRVGKDKTLMVRDIVTEGSSLVNSYRSQFRRIIEKKGKKKGVDELFQLMEKKLEKRRAKEKGSEGTSKTCSPPEAK